MWELKIVRKSDVRYPYPAHGSIDGGPLAVRVSLHPTGSVLSVSHACQLHLSS